MSKLYLLRITADKMALLLAADTESQKIVRVFHYHHSIIYYVQKNMPLFEEAKLTSILMIKRPQKITLRQ